MHVKDIMSTIPHRYPFLLVDKVLEMGENYIIAQKNVTINEPFFVGHFPDEPIMPGVLQIEAMAQASGLLAQRFFGDINYRECEIFFMSLDNVKFRRPVIPGDILVMRVDILNKKSAMFKFKGSITVEGNVVTEGEFMVMVRRKK
ncbi:MAG: 3-hydroxyacyl-ACP dehydratase FabZ [Calditerrivibrio sp.]|nr:3-hydroxyacyl-ACP dehydratase FabZ [Calditerrivibrio sp.]MCA1933224.1 3-hydroxyacyl-ACP dehydratase FabZ [Calditerrivibrio sp.]MCA1980304.1 3-hydroxyacyl-ACP dehydratase FabZ [Calditerrivibrio sp.]